MPASPELRRPTVSSVPRTHASPVQESQTTRRRTTVSWVTIWEEPKGKTTPERARSSKPFSGTPLVDDSSWVRAGKEILNYQPQRCRKVPPGKSSFLPFTFRVLTRVVHAGVMSGVSGSGGNLASTADRSIPFGIEESLSTPPERAKPPIRRAPEKVPLSD
jgi:hypothetical protein